MNKMSKVIAIVGPTASGKTGVGVRLAKNFDGEIVSADSRQIYRGLDLGTGKDLLEYDGVRYHLIDIVDPGNDFSMFKWLEAARKAIEDIFSRGKMPIVVGGTGLYIQALTEGFELKCKDVISTVVEKSLKVTNERSLDKLEMTAKGIGDNKYTREQLEGMTREKLQEILKELDPELFEKIDKNNPHRLIRAIERAQEGTKAIKVKPDFEVLQIGLDWPREELYKRIDKRVDDRFDQGMLQEVQTLLDKGVDPEWLMKLGLEYKHITQYLLSIMDMDDPELEEKMYEGMKQELKFKSHQYARRQLTWLRRFPETIWEDDYNKIEQLVKDYLK